MAIKILMIDDDLEQCRQIKDLIKGEIISGEEIFLETIHSFEEFMAENKKAEYDIIILDLKGPNRDTTDNYMGDSILEEIKKKFFVPIIFYTGFPREVQKHSSELIKIVNKNEAYDGLKKMIGEILNSKLPSIKNKINEYIKENLRDYMWNFVHKDWLNISKTVNKELISYLLTKRLGYLLSEKHISNLLEEDVQYYLDLSHPLDFYIYPPLEKKAYSPGDILIKDNQNYVLLTPACDLELKKGRRKADNVLLIKTIPLNETPEYLAFKENNSNSTKGELKKLIENRNGERFFFLPKTWFIEDSLLDFQKISVIKYEDLEEYSKTIELNPSHANSLLSKFIRYYNRIGTKDISSDEIVSRIEEELNEED